MTAFAFAQSKNKNNSAAYSFASQDLDGNKISSELFADNKITMINIWGTFCGPCIREMPSLAKLSDENKSKGVEIIGIPIDIIDDWGRLDSSAKSDALMIMKQTGVKYKNLVPTIEMFQTFLRGIQAVPTTVFVDKNGKQIGQAYLGAKSQKDWQKIIDKLLETQK
jgi:thiol-disulfide isomerase/thioredoxin